MKTLNLITSQARNCHYNEVAKELYRQAAMRWLRALAKELGLDKKDYEIRFNPGGIAVCGDATLHHEKIYVTINDLGAMWRTCKHRKDYTGGGNRWINGEWGRYESRGVLIADLRRALAVAPSVN